MKTLRFIFILSVIFLSSEAVLAETNAKGVVTNNEKEQTQADAKNNPNKYNFALFNFFNSQTKSTTDTTDLTNTKHHEPSTTKAKPVL